MVLENLDIHARKKKFSILPIILDKSLPRWNSGKEFVYIAGYVGLIPGSERYLEVGNYNPLQYSTWRISWAEELGGLQSMGLQRISTTE